MKESATLAKLEAAANAFSSERLRWLIGKGDVLVQRGELTADKLNSLLRTTVREEINRSYILIHLGKEPQTVAKIAKATSMRGDYVLSNLLAMIKWNQVAIVGQDDNEYLYAAKAV